MENFEVLIEDKRLSWEPASDGRVAAGAVSTGRDGNEELFIGRAPFQSSLTVGKVKAEKGFPNRFFISIDLQIHPSHGCLYLPFNGREERVTHYEVLVYSAKKEKCTSRKNWL